MYAARFPEFVERGFYREVRGMQVSSLGIGTYLGEADDATDRSYIDALLAAAEGGINFFDTAINYRKQRSERSIGAALKQLNREEIIVCTKAGFVTPGAVPENFPRVMHSMDPDFLEDQIARSRGNLGIDTIDVFYLHNPETQLRFLARDAFDSAIRQAFARLETLAERGWIRWYGTATWEGFRQPGQLDLRCLAAIATEEGGRDHRFRFIQLPFNLGMVEAFTNHTLEAAAELDITVVASATLMQTRVLEHMPDAARDLLPGLATDAQRAIQFTRSTPGISVALVGMSQRAHVLDNLGVACVPPLSREQYLRLFE